MPLDKATLGVRYTCFQCGAKFYDLNRPEPICPSCSADQREDPNPDPIEEMLRNLSKRRRRKKKAETTAEPESEGSNFFPDFGGNEEAGEGTKEEKTSDEDDE